jgi:integrase
MKKTKLIHLTSDELAALINAAVEKTFHSIPPPVKQSTRGLGFCLDKRENKSHGFLYYVRYRHNGKMLPSKWCTGTNDFLQARAFAIRNREKIIAEYLESKADASLYTILASYYEKDSEYLQVDKNRKRTFCEQRRRIYHNFVNNKFIPFLKRRKITRFEQIKPSDLSDLQDELLAAGNKPQTINDHLSGVKLVFDHLVRKRGIEINPFKQLESLLVGEEDVKITGCYGLDKLKGVFNTAWSGNTRRLLCLLAYTTGMREIEIMRMRMSDIITIGKYRFIDIKESKTVNGIRIVPLHDFVFKKLAEYTRALKLEGGALIFEKLRREEFAEANMELALMLAGKNPDEGKIKDELQAQNITFKSGRHFWKTMMNAKDLGEDIEEIFMGHRVTKDVAKIYNHRDKQGKEKIIKKTRLVMSILDKVIFRDRDTAGTPKKKRKKPLDEVF